MSFLDRFRTKPPARKARGGSGRGHFNGIIVPDERNAALTGRQGLQTFDEMWRTDPDIRRVGAMLINPLIGATAEVQPYGGEEAEERDQVAAKATEWMLQSVMRPTLSSHLTQGLPVLVRSGFCPFEQVWGTFTYEGKTLLAPKTLALRLPRTVLKWHQDGEELTGIQQLLDSGGTVDIPAEDLVYYRLGAEGDNWEGTSLLRPVYKPWRYKDGIERMVGVKAEREAMGVPIVYPPATGNVESQLDTLEEALDGFRTAETAFIFMPGPAAQHLGPEQANQGWHLDIVNPGGSGTESGKGNLIQYLEYHGDRIAAAFLAEFMRLGQGQTSVGARATAEVQQDPFTASLQALASVISTTLQESVIERFIALNFEVEEPPKLKLILDDSIDLAALATYVKQLVDSKALVADEPLEDFLREHAGLPSADPDERKRQAEMREAGRQALLNPPEPPATPPGPGPRPPGPAPQPPAPAPKPPANKADDEEVVTEEREKRWWEDLMALDVIDSAITHARERFEKAAGDDARALVRELTGAALKGKQPPAKPPAELAAAIAGELEQLYRTGQLTVRSELDAQRGSEAPAGGAAADKSARELARRATLAAQSIAQRIWQRVSQSALARPGDEAAAQRAGEQEAGAALRAEAQLHAASAVNLGRQDEAEAHADEIAGARYTSLLDANRCERCALADDDVLRPLTDPVRLAHRPPNPDCYGGGRCRCMEFYELSDEAAGSPGTPPTNPLTSGPSPRPVASHFTLEGGTREQRELVVDQLGAIESVHKLPRDLPKTPIRIEPIPSNQATHPYGRFSISATRQRITDTVIQLDPRALSQSPPITSTVHEVGHLLDAVGMGDGLDFDLLLADQYTSAGPAFSEWKAAVTSSHAFRILSRTGTSYEQEIAELFARSYEQYIATRSGNAALLAKIAARRRQKTELYWDDADFTAIAEAFDRLLTTRGLRS